MKKYSRNRKRIVEIPEIEEKDIKLIDFPK
jgi:hypothetical protein